MYENEIQSIAARESDAEIYAGLLQLTKDIAKQKGQIQGKKKLYYISAEFLIGKLLSNNLINLGIYDLVANALKEHGKSLAQIEEIENEPSLGNGGLGQFGGMFFGFDRNTWSSGRRCRLELSFGTFSAEIRKQFAERDAKSVDYGSECLATY